MYYEKSIESIIDVWERTRFYDAINYPELLWIALRCLRIYTQETNFIWYLCWKTWYIIILFLICSNVWNGNLMDFEPWSKVIVSWRSVQTLCLCFTLSRTVGWRWVCVRVIVSFPSWPLRKYFFALPRHPLEVKQVGFRMGLLQTQAIFFSQQI